MIRQFACVLLAAATFASATEPSPETRRWWSHVQALANDNMEGRDTGSPGYLRAEHYVIRQFERLGLQPAGEKGFVQTVSLRKLRFREDQSTAVLTGKSGTRELHWLENIAGPANAAMPTSLDAPLVFVGSADYAKNVDVTGKIIVQLNPKRLVKDAPKPVLSKVPAGAVGILGIDRLDSLEPPRWPQQYTVSVALREDPPRASTASEATILRFNPAQAEWLFKGSGHSYEELRQMEAQGQKLPSFDLPLRLKAALKFETYELESDNVLGMLPGSDASLRDQVIVISAHLDGYGFGSPWKGDRIYNGTFDDAAYVATLIETVERWKEAETRLRRSVLLAVFTGEEKGLLGSRYFTRHLTVPRDRIVANINLDQLRPLFPLKELAMVGLNDSTLGDVARKVAEPMGLRIEPDREPWRNLIRRADNWSFMQIGVPAAGFVLAPEQGTQDSEIYAEWYRLRYHTPLDDLKQPWDPGAAAKFNEYFSRLIENLANSEETPRWNPQSPYAPQSDKH
ncbi:MAG TPA: M28 family peptidase [Bryobacteraceae bacterium]|nr:M28 family peptidase [Bryobacteraceae bacterium]